MAEKVVFDKNVERPDVAAPTGGRKPKYDFSAMDVGDSLAEQINPGKTSRLPSKLAALAAYARKMGWKVSTRTIGNKIRMWRDE